MSRILFNTNGTAKSDLFKVPLASLTADKVFQLTEVKINRLKEEKGNDTEAIVGITYTIYVPDIMGRGILCPFLPSSHHKAFILNTYLFSQYFTKWLIECKKNTVKKNSLQNLSYAYDN